MNETLNSLMQRRSIRAFKPEQIKDEDLQQIVDAALHAPTAMNRQPWHFTVVQNRQVIDKVVEIQKNAFLHSGDPELVEKGKDTESHNFYHAPTVIFLSGTDSNASANAAQNICLASYALGLGSCYIASFLFGLTESDIQQLHALLELPEGVTLYFAVAIGYSEGEHPQAPEQKPDTVNYIK